MKIIKLYFINIFCFIIILYLFNINCLFISHNTIFECTVIWELIINNNLNSTIDCKIKKELNYIDSTYQYFNIPGNSTKFDTIHQTTIGNNLVTDNEFVYLLIYNNSMTLNKDSLWINPFPFPKWEMQSLCSEYYEIRDKGKYICTYYLSDTISIMNDTIFSTVDYSSYLSPVTK